MLESPVTPGDTERVPGFRIDSVQLVLRNTQAPQTSGEQR